MRLAAGAALTTDGTAAPGRVDVLGVPVACLTFAQLLSQLERALEENASKRACFTYVNAYGACLAARDVGYRTALGHADWVYADGIGVVWASRLLGRGCPERVSIGPSEFDRIMNQCVECHASVFFLGGAAGIAERVARHALARQPALVVAGSHHGYFTEDESDSVVRAVNDSGAAVLIVGLGPPRQERWVACHWEQLQVRASWCLGGLFDQIAGAVPYPPDWVRRNHVHWLYRLIMEPRRLWRRYLLGIPAFIARVVHQRFAQGRRT